MAKQIDMGELGRHLFAKIMKATASDGTYGEIMQETVKSKTNYIDEAFPPNETSLINDWQEDEVYSKVRLWRQFEWIRATQIEELNDSEGKLQVFANEVDPRDIKQGVLGDCYFLSCLSVLAEYPKRIKRLFVQDKQNNYGVYAVKICKNGEWKEVVIDDYIPCHNGKPCFSKANGNELWVLLLEKAWAKLHGSYERIEAGFAENVLHDLTGAPTEVIETDDQNLFEKLKNSDKNKWVMAASAGSTEASKEVLEEIGLIGNHSYGLIDVIEFKDMYEDTIQLVKLNNPWGEFEWKGDWSDDSDLWTEESKRIAKWSSVNEGSFFMSLKDFKTYFSRVQICRLNDDYKYAFLKARQQPGQFSLLRFVVAAPGGHAYLSVIQTDERCFSRQVDYEYSNVRLIVMKIENPDDEKKILTYKNGKMGWMRDTWEEYLNLEPGDYYMYVEFDWPQTQEHHEFCVSYYGAATSYFLRDESAQYQKHELLAQLMASCAEQELAEPKQKITNFADQGAPNVKKYFCMTEEGYGYVHIVNNEKEAEFTEVVNYTKFDRLSLMKPYKGDGYSIVVKPGEKRTIVIRQDDPLGFSLQSQIMQSTFKMGPKAMEQLCKTGKDQKTIQRVHTQSKQPLEIYQHQYKHQAGICYFYENKTENKTLEETLKFTLSGLEIVDSPGVTEVKVVLKPGQTRLVELKAVSYPWKIASSIGYLIR